MKEVFMEEPEKKYRPEVRWWLAEGMHTDQTLRHEMEMLEEMGMGAVEFLAMEEPGADSKIYGWGSEEWVHDSHILAEEAAKRGLGISMTSGTNWSNANLTSITPDDKAASKELDCVIKHLNAGEAFSGELPRCEIRTEHVSAQELVAVVAAKVLAEEDGVVRLDPKTTVLTEQVEDQKLYWTAPEDGAYELFLFWLHGTGQTAKPSCDISYTINYLDHYGVDAFIDYWEQVVLTEKLRKDLAENARGMLYMDSLELSVFGDCGQLWGYHLNEEFQKRRGYPIEQYLPFVIRKTDVMTGKPAYRYTMADAAFLKKLHNDLYQTMTELYMENMLKPMREWLHGLGMGLRAEISYGLPFEISLPGKYVDGVETESLEFASQIESYRGLAGTAHLYDRIFSSETGATLLNYMMPLDFYNQICFSQFAAGVTKTVFHGYASICGSEEGTYWPGHEGMYPLISERFGCRQPAFRHYRDWTGMLARFQKLLRAGIPRMDLGILRLDYHYNNMIYSPEGEEKFYAEMGMRGHEGLYWKDMGLQENGYTWDYFAPQILEEDFAVTDGEILCPEGPGYQALIVYQEEMPLSSAGKLLQLAEKGLKILFVNGVTEENFPMGGCTFHRAAASRTPYVMESEKRLHEIIREMKALPNVMETDDQKRAVFCLEQLGVKPRAAFLETNPDILTCMRQDKEKTNLFVYYMQYTEKNPVKVSLRIAGGGRPYEVDCWSGAIKERSGVEENGSTVVTVTLNPGEATMLIFDRTERAELLPAEKIYHELELPRWHLQVEDWTEGAKREILEERKAGIVTREVYFETKKTMLDAGDVELLPWKEIPEVGKEVSGIGFYKTEFALPEAWEKGDGARLEITSTNGGTAAVYVNGKKAPAYNMNRRTVEIGSLLREGTNEIVVEVSSSLNNRLKACGYYDTTFPNTIARMMGANNGNGAMEEAMAGVVENNGSAPENTNSEISALVSMMTRPTPWKDYGMTGGVSVLFYREEKADEKYI